MDSVTELAALLRGVHVAALLALFGTLVFAAIVLPDDPDAVSIRARVTRQARYWLLASMVTLILWFAVEAAAIAAPGTLRDWLATLPTVTRNTRPGHVIALRLLLLAAVPLVARLRPTAAVLPAGLALTLQPALGHAGAEGGTVGATLTVSEALHLLAAGSWLGGLVPLLTCIARLPPPVAARVCERFTPLGLVAVGTIAITATLQAGQLIGSVPGLVGTAYGRTALLKLVLFLALLGLAALNRLRLTAALAEDRRPRARRHLLLSVTVETGIGLAAVLAAGMLASLPPAAHEQPVWPFPWRISDEALGDPLARWWLAAAAGAGIAGLAIAVLWRRRRALAAATGAGLLAGAVGAAAPWLTVPAYPTSFYHSPTGFAAESITRGQAVFAVNCIACHGADGRGDGPLAARLPRPPADLTAPHLWSHSDGDLFWWIGHGRPPMPGFAAILTEQDRWSVIDFIRANNAGRSLWAGGSRTVPVIAPSMPILCDGPAADEMRDLRGSVVLVLADGPGVAHQPAIPPQQGYPVVTLHIAERVTPPAPGTCVAATPTARGAWAVLAGLPPAQLGGAAFLVDPNGWLRAARLPGGPSDWQSREELTELVRRIRAHPIAITQGGSHEHHE